MKHELEVIIGLEVHVQLNTKSKMFCSCNNESFNAAPNKNVCPTCMGLVGTLPLINEKAFFDSVLTGLALGCRIANHTKWDRKNYVYPDLPKAYQISQFDMPLAVDGLVKIFSDGGSETKEIRINRLHLEEDAAKLVHRDGLSLIDFNRAGTPLMEIVTEPDLRSPEDAESLLREIRRVVRYLGVSDADLEKGNLRCDASISLRPKGDDKLYPRTEIKNLNSFKAVKRALDYEVQRQSGLWETGDYSKEEATVLWDDELQKTKFMRGKEGAADYRYFPEPDIPEVDLLDSEIQEIKDKLPKLPMKRIEDYLEMGLDYMTALFIAEDKDLSDYVEKVLALANGQDDLKKLLIKWFTGEFFGEVKKKGLENIMLSEEDFVSLIKVLSDGKASRINIKKIFNRACSEEIDVAAELAQIPQGQDVDIDGIIADVVTKNSEAIAKFKEGKDKALNALIGMVMKEAKGSVSPEEVVQKLKDAISGSAVRQPLVTLDSEENSTEEEYEDNSPNIILDSYRTHLTSDISDENLDQEVTLAGWVSSVRDHGELVFIDLRDSSYEMMQVKLDGSKFDDLDSLARIKPESVIMVRGKIIRREEDDFNPSIRTGKLELDTDQIDVLNPSKALPFEIKRAAKTGEATRLRYRFLDLRSQEARRAIVNRHRVIKLIRDILDEERFIEVETPILTAGTDEGAREFIVPSRKFAGSFYTLPQAPQQFKQMLMNSGVERYFQMARCFRDEDSRGDRQPEFTQFDLEMAFVSMQEVIELNSRLLERIVRDIYGNKWKMQPIRTLTYCEAMEKYGCDRPDLRFGLEMQDITEIVRNTTFQVFLNPILEGGIVKCIKVDAAMQKQRMSKGQIEKLTKIAQEHGLGGLAYIIVNEDELQSPIIKYLGEDIAAQIIAATDAQVGDIVFFSAASYKVANAALDAVRQEMGQMLNLIKPRELHPAWIVDFPLFDKTDDGGWTFSHNPFSLPKKEFIDDHINGENIGDILAQQYDLVLNGYEIGGGSIRAHKVELLKATYRNMGCDEEETRKSVGHMLDAFQYGTPPHGGIAWGIDRLMMILEEKSSIREVMAFPKTGSGEDLLFSSPSPLSDKKIREANIKCIEKLD